MAEVIIDRVRDHHQQQRDISAIEGIMLHRVGVNLRSGFVIGYDAESICDAFLGRIPQWESVAQATGRQNAYTFLIGGSLGPDDLDGKVWQALPIDEIGHHARQFSTRHLGIALIGDFRERAPSAKQWAAAVDLCSDLSLLLRIGPTRIVGHGEIPGAHGGDKGPGQRYACPGDLFSMGTFRLEVAEEIAAKMEQDARWRLEQANVRLP